MKKLLAFNVLLTLVIAFALTGCGDDDSESYAPTYGKMVFNPNPAAVGDSVNVVVEQTRKGYGLEKTTYSWTITFGIMEEDGTLRDSVRTITHTTNYDGLDNSDPKVGFTIPSNCVSRNATVSLSATFSGYIGNNLFLKANKTGTLTVTD